MTQHDYKHILDAGREIKHKAYQEGFHDGYSEKATAPFFVGIFLGIASSWFAAKIAIALYHWVLQP